MMSMHKIWNGRDTGMGRRGGLILLPNQLPQHILGMTLGS